jgi:hypothetical protein
MDVDVQIPSSGFSHNGFHKVSGYPPTVSSSFRSGPLTTEQSNEIWQILMNPISAKDHREVLQYVESLGVTSLVDLPYLSEEEVLQFIPFFKSVPQKRLRDLFQIIDR